MTSSTSTSSPMVSPGAVPVTSANPIVWWVAGGLGLMGAGALAAVLVAGPKNEAPAPEAAKPVASTKAATPAAKPAKLAAAEVCATCGTVESVKAEKHKGEGTGIGAVGGAVVGGVVGHQMGGGNGKKALTVLGAVGGGFAGHEIEKQARSTTVYQVQLRMDDGSTRTVTQSAAPAVGARFEVQGNQLKPLAAKG
ncbi:MAG TPA: glycine zipper 2TM domain-containing protein [Rhizobacter sp.]|nr:glycine zipper 2TM domain-containing protein [Rhizobacter sp.]